LVRDIFDRKLVSVLVARTSKGLLGYVLYFYTYSSFLAKPTLYIEDIFVSREARGTGVGEALFNRCLREARDHDCGRMEWQVLDWNRSAMRFYKKLGAEQVRDLVLFRHVLE
jgi:GNAT superfamily N-acetyltransferase